MLGDFFMVCLPIWTHTGPYKRPPKEEGRSSEDTMYQHLDSVYESGIQRQKELRQEVADDRLIRGAKRNQVTSAAPSNSFRFSHRTWLHQAYRGLLRRV